MKSKIELFVSKRVKEVREQKKISQQYLADCINVSRSFIANAENLNDPTTFNLDHLNEIAKILDCAPSDFLPNKPL